MNYIENEGAMFRSSRPGCAFPEEVWSRKQCKWLPYEGEVPKPMGWGEEISEEEAKKHMAWCEEQRAGVSGEKGA